MCRSKMTKATIFTLKSKCVAIFIRKYTLTIAEIIRFISLQLQSANDFYEYNSQLAANGIRHTAVWPYTAVRIACALTCEL